MSTPRQRFLAAPRRRQRGQRKGAEGVRQWTHQNTPARAFLSLDDVKDGPIRGEIAAVSEGGYKKLVLTFTNGLRFSLNATNCTEMIKALGSETDDWLGECVELYQGEALYQGEQVPSVRLTVLTRDPDEKKKPPPPQPKPKNSDLDDSIPF